MKKNNSELAGLDLLINKYLEKRKEQNNLENSINIAYKKILPELKKRYSIIEKVTKELCGEKLSEKFSIKLYGDFYPDDYIDFLENKFINISALSTNNIKIKYNNKFIYINSLFPKKWLDMNHQDFEKMVRKNIYIKNTKTFDKIKTKLNKKEISYLKNNLDLFI